MSEYGCCTHLILHFLFDDSFHNIFDFTRLREWSLAAKLQRSNISCHVLDRRKTLAGNVDAKKYKAILSDCLRRLMMKRFYPDGSGNVLRVILSFQAGSGHWEGRWKWKQCESLLLNSASCRGNENRTLHNYKPTTEKWNFLKTILVLMQLWNLQNLCHSTEKVPIVVQHAIQRIHKWKCLVAVSI